ncbi:hypothetical protein Ciccas_010696 [Cichlidogyrus casuarinus]|uniref:SCP domain-containing protein n=1 Tax=Cichlidogyrus casuarinus TaxID=1844966 RepID=A0ABD2PU88_9PLAT
MGVHDEFLDECLREHNEKRKMHGVPPLRHNRFLDESAQEWADQLITKEQLVNSGLSNRGELGESISMRTSTGTFVDIQGSEVVNQWYNDINNYDYVNCKGPAGNFTQLIWASSKEVGFGKANVGGKCIVVAHYRPPGNIRGRYPENVFPLKKEYDSFVTNTKNSNLDDEGTTKSVTIEYVKQPDGREVRVKKEVVESYDKMGNVVRRVRETFLDEEAQAPAPADENYAGNSSMSEDEAYEPRNLSQEAILEKRSLRNYMRQIVHQHNVYRLKHGAPKLKHSRRLSALAQEWADKLLDATYLSNSGFIYNGKRMGENIASRWSNNIAEYPAAEIIEGWYGENAKFEYGTEPNSIQGIGNFTQMVWKESHLIGVGRAIRNTGHSEDMPLGDSASSIPGLVSSRYVVVCFYFPAGNVATEFARNVPPPLK